MKKVAVVDKGRCAACGVCMQACRKEAIAVWRGCHAAVEEGKCVGCGLCVKACPAGCIQLQERSAVK